MDKVYALIGAVLFSLMVNFMVDFMPVVGAVEQVEAMEQVDAVDEEAVVETASIDAPTKIVYSEEMQVEKVYYDEAFQSWYVVGNGWALEATEESAKNAVDKNVKIEYYVVDGQEIILGWGAL